jgi:hypothetical protein
VFCGRHLLLARQRRANVAGSDGAVEEVARIVAQIRRTWPRVHITLRADSGFCNDPMMRWCEANRVDYVFGLARNRRLEAALVEQLAQAKELCLRSGKPARVFRDFCGMLAQSEVQMSPILACKLPHQIAVMSQAGRSL